MEDIGLLANMGSHAPQAIRSVGGKTPGLLSAIFLRTLEYLLKVLIHPHVRGVVRA